MAKDSDTFRENAENCLHLAEQAVTEQASNRYKRMSRAWFALAIEQDWLDGISTNARATELAGDERDRLSDEGAGRRGPKS